MSKRIGIVGAGTAGLQLGLYLRQNDIDATIFTDRTPDQYAEARLPATVAHHAVTVERERALGIDTWPTEDYGYFGHHYYVGGPQPMWFYGDYHAPSRAIDYRIYHPQLMEEFLARGGKIEYKQIAHDEISSVASQFDLLVVCTGKGPFGQMFSRIPEHSLDKPLRQLCVGVFRGITQMPQRTVVWGASPGAGEMIEIPYLTFGGMASALVLDNQPGGDLEVLTHTSYDDDPKAFISLLLEKLRAHYPKTAERIEDERDFDLANSPRDLLQGALTPVVRETHTVLDDGTIALSLGDVHSTVDPVLGQGGNMASYDAWLLGEEITKQDVFDERFVEKFDLRRRDRVLAAQRWTQFILQACNALPPEFQEFLGALNQSRALADEFTDNFNFPENQWDIFAHPSRTASWIAKQRDNNTQTSTVQASL